jgi:hypothetical protein
VVDVERAVIENSHNSYRFEAIMPVEYPATPSSSYLLV